MHSNYKNIASMFYASKPETTENDLGSKYKITNIDDPNGWSFNEIEHLSQMGFLCENEYSFIIEVENVDFSDLENLKKDIVEIYKTKEGYVINTNRKYIFESFKKMIEFIENSKSDMNF